jgi:hypothetical protein
LTFISWRCKVIIPQLVMLASPTVVFNRDFFLGV